MRPKCFIAPSYHGGPLYIQESCGIGTPSKHSPEIFLLIFFHLYPSSQFYSFFTSTDISVTEFEKMFTLYKEGYWQRRERVPCCSACTLKREISGENIYLRPLISAFTVFSLTFSVWINKKWKVCEFIFAYLDIKAFTYLGLYLTMKEAFWAIF